MDMSGEYRIPASRQTVWEALNDPEILKAAIPGCEELTAEGETGFAAKVRAKVGPVSARFSGKVQLLDLDPPNGYRIEGEGTGGAAGFAKGGASVQLAEDGGETVLTYQANASVGGKLAQIGSRLIDGAAKKMADDFFAKFSAIVGEQAGASAAPAAPPPPHGDGTPAMGLAAEELAEDAYDTARHVAHDAADAVSHAASETAHAAAEELAVAETSAKGVPQWMWIAGAAVILVGLVIFLT
ncbi:MAG: carbon monoxide dehydrogenase subunit G [Alphaproteobacteria bacterium]|nr:carbon monoxide dehydrogenase subunit G [Alphaproteobacteria bacterium]